MLNTDGGADGGVGAKKPYVASIALLIPGGEEACGSRYRVGKY